MKVIGKVVCFSPNDLIVVKGSFAPSMGGQVVDRRSNPMGRIIRITGPVKSPYVLVRPAPGCRGQLNRLLGRDVFLAPRPEWRGRNDGKDTGGRGHKVSRVWK